MPGLDPIGIPGWVYDYVTSKPFKDAVRNAVDAKWLADNVPVTGAKAEVTGVKAEANAGALSLFGVQTEYSILKHEYSVNQFLEDRAQRKRESEVDGQFKRLTADLGSTGKLVEQVKQELKSTATALRKTLGEGDKQLRREVPQLRTSVDGLRRRLLDADQVLHGRISKLTNQVTQLARTANERGKAEKARVKELDKEVRAGLRQVQALQGSAKGASRDIGILIDRVTALERALR